MKIQEPDASDNSRCRRSARKVPDADPPSLTFDLSPLAKFLIREAVLIFFRRWSENPQIPGFLDNLFW